MVHGITGHNFETRQPSDDSDQDWFPLVSYFQRRRFLKKFTTYDGRQVMAIAHLTRSGELIKTITQGFQSGPVPGTFTRLRSCIVPAEITEPPQKLAVVKTTSTMVDRLVE